AERRAAPSADAHVDRAGPVVRSAILALGLVMLTGACATQQQLLRGRVSVTSMGPRPLTTLVTDTTGPIALEGPLEPELRRINGAYVEVEGKRRETPPNGGIDVERYVILEIEGEQPFVGALDPTGTRLVTEDGSTPARADPRCNADLGHR